METGHGNFGKFVYAYRKLGISLPFLAEIEVGCCSGLDPCYFVSFATFVNKLEKCEKRFW